MNQAIVINNHTLAILNGVKYQILSASNLRGASQADGWNYIGSQKYRLASLQDFKDFRVIYHPDYKLA